MKNEESTRLFTEASSKIYLVNFISMRMLMSVRIKSLIHSCSTVKYIPAWVPGAGFQRVAAHVKKLNQTIRHGPWEKVLKGLVSRRLFNLNYPQAGVGLWDSSTQLGEQTDRALRCERENAGYGVDYLWR